MNNEKIYLSWDQIHQSLIQVSQKYRGQKVNIVAPHRGGTILGIMLNNLLDDSTLSVVSYSTRHGTVDEQAKFLDYKINETYDTTLIIDDIFDTGKTYNEVKYLVEQYYSKPLKSYFIISKHKKKSSFIYDERADRWWVFPWEMT